MRLLIVNSVEKLDGSVYQKTLMKKLIVCFALASIAAMPVFAGEKCKSKKGCADKAKTECPSKKDKKACDKSASKQAALAPKAK